MACPTVTAVGTQTYGIVESQLGTLLGYASNSYGAAVAAMQAMTDGASGGIAEAGIGIGAGALEETPGESLDFTRPDDPELIEAEFDSPSVPESPDIDTSGFVLTVTATPPVLTATPPTFVEATRPNKSPPIFEEDAPSLDIPEYPTAPDDAYPDLPILRNIELPVLLEPDLSNLQSELDALRARKPDVFTGSIDNTFLADISTQYTLNNQRLTDFVAACPAFSSLADRLTELLSGGSVGYSDAVSSALRNRAFSAIDRKAAEDESQARDEWLARGFTLPTGALESKIAKIRQSAVDQRAAANRDVFIEEAKQEIETLRFAVQQGITYQGLYQDSFFKLLDASVSIARQVFDVLTGVLSFALEKFKANLELWKTDSAVFRDWLQVELAALEVNKNRLEEARLIGTINQQDIDLYLSRLKIVDSKISLYSGKVSAANAVMQGQLSILEGYKTKVQAYSALMGGYEAEWKAYGQAMQGEAVKAQFYDSLVKSFSAEVDAYSQQVDTDKSIESFKLDTARLDLQIWESQMERFKGFLQRESSLSEANSKISENRLRLYSELVGAEKSVIDTDIRKQELALSAYGLDTSTSIKKLELAQTKVLETTKIVSSAQEAAARIAAQVASGALSAFNVGATISSSSGFTSSTGCNTTYSYRL